MRQLLIESIALSSHWRRAGLAVGRGMACARSTPAFKPPARRGGCSFTMDYTVLMYVAAICIGTGILFGSRRRWHLSSGNQHETLKEGGRGSFGTRRANRFGQALIVGELALTVVLLCGAGLMLRSFIALYATDPGFAVDGLSRMKMQLPPSKYPTADARRRFFEQLQPRIEAIPGVQSAAFATSVPPLDDEEWRFEDRWPDL